MLVYRVEHNGIGPYVSPVNGLKLDERPTKSRPMPDDDGITGDLQNPYAGFLSLEQLNQWFRRKEKLALHRADYRVSVLHCDDDHVRLGRRQVAFNISKAKLIVTLPIPATVHYESRSIPQLKGIRMLKITKFITSDNREFTNRRAATQHEKQIKLMKSLAEILTPSLTTMGHDAVLGQLIMDADKVLPILRTAIKQRCANQLNG